MKNKSIKKIMQLFLSLTAALILTGGFSMTAYAGGGEEYDTEPEEVATEPVEDSDPLTPEGNATLVDDIWGGNKQLITVTTKAGNYFYILIDRAAEGENTVHFLNKVDEADLMALIDEDEKEETPLMPQSCTCTDKCHPGEVNESCPVCLNNLNACKGTEKVEETPEAEPQPEEEPKKSSGAAGLILLLFVAAAGGGAFYYFKIYKGKGSSQKSPDFSEFDFDDEDEETEDEPDDDVIDDGDKDDTGDGEYPDMEDDDL